MSTQRIIAEIERRIKAHTNDAENAFSETIDTRADILNFRTRAAELARLNDWIAALLSADFADCKLRHHDELLSQYIVERDLARKAEAERDAALAELAAARAERDAALIQEITGREVKL